MRKLVLIISLALVLMLLWTATASAASPPAEGGFWHRVRYGETLSSIGWRYGVNPYRICAANGLRNCNYIWAGQLLWIPRRTTPYYQQTYDRFPRYCATYHTVRSGQTLYGLSRRYGVSPWAIARTNGIRNLNRIYAGQTLCIPGRF